MYFELLNLGSLVFGLTAWVLPVINLALRDSASHKGWAVYAVASSSACALALCLQIFSQNYLVRVEAWSALMDTSRAVALVSALLLMVTIVLNTVSIVIYRRRSARQG